MKFTWLKKYKMAGIITLLVIIITTGLVSFNEDRDFKLLKNLDIYYSLFRELNVFYVDEIEPEKLVETSIDEMLQSLDPYTVYIPESDIDDYKFATTGKYGGIGSLIRKSGDFAVISEIYKGFPANLSGIKPGDIIKTINGKSIEGLELNKISDRLKGLPDTDVTLSVARYGIEEPIDFTVTRKRIHINGVPYYGMLNNKTGYIRLSNFTKDCSDDVKNALTDLKEIYSPESLILDLRGNPGGLLIEAVKVANLFVEKGQEIVSTKGKIERFNQTYRTKNQPVDKQIPLVVLVNRGSASASEIVAGALQDLDRAVITGTRTYGKGLVQTTRPLSYNSKLKVTTAKYYIPSGRCIQALDYSNRNENGSVGHIPDSIISEYKTKNGRIVYDGGGVSPDIEITKENLSQITVELITNFMIFDYSTQYYHTHDTILPPEKFVITDSIFTDFISYVKKHDFSYETKTEQALNKLIKTAKAEKYYQLSEDEFNALSENLSHNLVDDMNNFKQELKIMLEESIVSRYYYRSGMIQSSLPYDEQIENTLEILSDKNKYQNTLNPSGLAGL